MYDWWHLAYLQLKAIEIYNTDKVELFWHVNKREFHWVEWQLCKGE